MNAENLLLVEGPDDVHVVSELLKEHGMTRLRDEKDKRIRPLQLFFEDRPLDIMPVADEDKVVARFETVLAFTNQRPKVVGLILDFDAPNEVQSNNQDESVREVICRLQQSKECQWNLPDDFTVRTSRGFIAEPADTDTPRIGVWLMPNNQDRGMLETFLQKLVPESRRNLLNYAQSATDTAKEKHGAPFKPVHQDKAAVHTFLAWMDEPGRPFGIFFQNHSFEATSSLALLFVEWLKKLFRD